MSSLFHLPQFIKLWQIFLELNSNRLYKSSGKIKEKEDCCLEFTLSIKRITTKFHDVVVQLRYINGQKSVMHVHSCWFANLNLLLFSPFTLASPSSLLKLPHVVPERLPVKYQIKFSTRYFEHRHGMLPPLQARTKQTVPAYMPNKRPDPGCSNVGIARNPPDKSLSNR